VRILLLGGNGQVGRELRRSLAPLGELVVATRDGADAEVAADFDAPSSLAQLVAQVAPDVVVNAVAYTAVDKAETDVEAAFRVNAEAPGAIARACALIDALLIHYSTDYVLDGMASRPCREDDASAPLGVYGASKRAGELAIEASGATAIVLRTSWVYARHGTNFLTTIERLANERDELRVVADQTGVPNWTRTLANATAQLIERGRDELGAHAGLYHLSAHGACTWYDFACAILRDRGTRVLPITTAEYPTPARRPAYGVLDASRFAQTFGFALSAWETTLRQCLDAPVEPPRALPVN
jgi:dTDP-4-dehydrorhamnose reductase